MSHTVRLCFNSKHQWDHFTVDSREAWGCRETIHQREVDITQPGLMIYEVLYMVLESLEVSSDMYNIPNNGQPPSKNRLVPSVQ